MTAPTHEQIGGPGHIVITKALMPAACVLTMLGSVRIVRCTFRHRMMCEWPLVIGRGGTLLRDRNDDECCVLFDDHAPYVGVLMPYLTGQPLACARGSQWHFKLAPMSDASPSRV